VFEAMKDATPVEVGSSDPEHRSISLHAEGEALLVLSQLADPQWEGEWLGHEGSTKAEPLRAFGRPNEGAWQAFRLPGNGDWTLRLVYRAHDVRQGLWFSAISASIFGACFVVFGRDRTPAYALRSESS
jgi:hypothetical protein